MAPPPQAASPDCTAGSGNALRSCAEACGGPARGCGRLRRRQADATAALAAFRKSCPALQKRIDRSGLTQPGDWAAACAAANTATDPQASFATTFRAVHHWLAAKALPPAIMNPKSPARAPPRRAMRCRSTAARPISSKSISGCSRRISRAGRCAAASLIRRWCPITTARRSWPARSPGKGSNWPGPPTRMTRSSSKFRARDGCACPTAASCASAIDSQNGRDYVAIGKVLLDRGAGARASDHGRIIGWLRAHPAEAPAILTPIPATFLPRAQRRRADRRDGCCRDAQCQGRRRPGLRSARCAVAGRNNTARGVPLTAVMVAQDTGGAIKGANRIDISGQRRQGPAKAGARARQGADRLLLPRRHG